MDLETATSQAELLGTPFDGYLKYQNYRVRVGDQSLVGGFVHGPGHNVSAIASLAFDAQMVPHPIFKTGDTRLSRHERGEPYVLVGIVAGRMDKAGYDASKIVLAELAEEVGGEVVEGTFLPLGGLIPTMPFESTEADSYHLAAVEITGTPYGDGGAMEVVDLIGPVIWAPLEAFAALDRGEVAESARARAMYGRAFDAIGYLPTLGVYVQDHPRLQARFDSLGTAPALDFRAKVQGGEIPLPAAPGESLESRINSVACDTREDLDLGQQAHMVVASTYHAVREGDLLTRVGRPFSNQFLKLGYDRAKVALLFLDPQGVPQVEMRAQARPALAFAPEALKAIRLDLLDVEIPREGDPLEQIRQHCPAEAEPLGDKTCASSGQCDLYYHFAVCQVESGGDSFVPLSEAIRLCRTGHGDAQTEGLLQRLADRLEWIPSLSMTAAEARANLEPAQAGFAG